MRPSILSCLAPGSWLPATALATMVLHDGSFTPDHILRVTVAQLSSGCQSREEVVVNGTSPGPPLHILPGATTWVRVYNDMTDQNLTMHWHGLTQSMAPFADGTPLASQWPIPPGHFFDYEIITRPDDSGTYFYHSHVLMQALSSTGPLIIDDCGTSPYDYDDERVFFFEDYFAKTDGQMVGGAQGLPFQWTGETDGILLNGQGVSSGQTAVTGPPGGHRGRYGAWHGNGPQSAPGNGNLTHYRGTSPDCTLPVIDVDPGKTYRFRFIGATGLSFLAAAIEGHGNLTIVQVDGNEYNQPVDTGHVQLGAGQRFDVLFKTKTTEELKADGDKTTYFIQYETLERPSSYRGYGILRYSQDAEIPTAPSKEVIAIPTEKPYEWLEYAFQPLHDDDNEFPTAAEVTRRVTINCAQKKTESGGVEWQLAGLSWTENKYQTPFLVDIYKRGQAAIPDYDAAIKNGGWDPNTMSFPARVGEVLEIVLQNTGSEMDGGVGHVETHPFHAHSEHYYDIGGGKGAYDPDANNAKLAKLGYRPVKRDTTMLYKYDDNTVAPGSVAGWRAWRLRVHSPGVWMIHCHVLAHMMMGMQSVWVIGDAAQIMAIPFEESQAYLTYGGSVYGNVTHSPSYYEYSNGTKTCVPVKQGDGLAVVDTRAKASNVTRREVRF